MTIEEETEEEEEQDYAWVSYINQRITNNKNFILMFSGPTGSGKSLSAISLAEMLDPNFHVGQLIFRGKDLMKLINSGTLKSGSVIIWDEAGIDLSSRSWQSQTNRLLNYLIQTFRHKNFILIFTAPYGDFIDVATRKLFHAEFQTVTINKKNQTCRVKPKFSVYYPAKQKFYNPYLKKVVQGTGTVKIKRWDIPRPSKELEDSYEEMKIEFTTRLNKQIEVSLNRLDDEGKMRKPLTERQEKIIDCWKKGMFNQYEIAEIIGDNQGNVSRSEAGLKRKGYNKEEYLEKPIMLENVTS